MPDARTRAGCAFQVAHGTATLNDFKAMAGDRQLGIRSLPVQLRQSSPAWRAS
jgi:chlorophyll synthase